MTTDPTTCTPLLLNEFAFEFEGFSFHCNNNNGTNNCQSKYSWNDICALLLHTRHNKNKKLACIPSKIRIRKDFQSIQIVSVKDDDDDVTKVFDVILMEDVIGAEVLPSNYDCEGYDNCQADKKDGGSASSSKRILKIYCYSKMGHNGNRVAMHRIFDIDLKNGGDDDGSSSVLLNQAEDCARIIRSKCSFLPTNHLNNTNNHNRKYLVIVNPVSGKKNASHICKYTVKPMFDQARIPYEVFTTHYRGQAMEWATNEEWGAAGSNQKLSKTFPEFNMKDYVAVITIGGDGLLAELFQGIQLRKDSQLILSNIMFGIIGGGTSNGLAASILHANSVSMNIIRNKFVNCHCFSLYCYVFMRLLIRRLMVI